MKLGTIGCLLLAVSAIGLPTVSAADLSSAEARAIAVQAYIYGYPLVDYYRIIWAYNSDPALPTFRAPLNQLNSAAELLTPADRVVVTPNSDTLYSGATLDLRAEPIVLTLPPIEPGRYYSAQLVDLFTFNFGYLGSRTTGNAGGNFLVAGPDWKGEAPPGVAKVLRAETQLVGVVLRTQVFGPGDLDKVRHIQAGYRLQPLSTYLGQPAPQAVPAIQWLKPPAANQQRTSPDFFNVLRFALEFCPVHESERDLRAQFANIGLVPGRPFDLTSFAPELKLALLAGLADGQKAIDARRAAAAEGGDVFGSRESLKNDYLARAAGAQIGILGNSREEAIYIPYEKDSERQPLDASQYRYVIRFASDQLPPAGAFWSLTMYDLPGQFLVTNPLNRYLVNSPMLPSLQRDADGGLTLRIQRESPGGDEATNWLPAPAGPFMMVLRIYCPKPEVLDGTWKVPPVERVK